MPDSQIWTGPCPQCCTCPQPNLKCSANSGTYNGGCGYINGSTIYLTYTEHVYTVEPTNPSCVASGEILEANTRSFNSDGSDCDITYACSGSLSGTVLDTFLFPDPQPFHYDIAPDCSHITCVGDAGCCGGDANYLTYSNPIAADVGINYAIARQTGYGAFSGTNRQAFTYSLYGGGLGYNASIEASVTDVKYYFTLPAKNTIPTGCYRVTWDLVTRDSLNNIISTTPQSYQWDGTATQTPTLTLSHPTTPGSITIANTIGRCYGCSHGS